MRCLLPILALISVAECSAQYPIGTTAITFNDADRGRDIATVIHYPAAVQGTDAEVAAGNFPVLVHGHGFLMGVASYENLRDHHVPRGYILVLPTTEGGLPDHEAFGLDLAFLAAAMQAQNELPGSLFEGHVAGNTAIMGHSMGGGASLLASAGNGSIQTLVNFAAAETDPSAITAATQITVPSLMFAASEDCVTPIDANQQPMYDALGSDCKALVNILGGGHCYFANSDIACQLGEFTCGPDLTIDRAEQHAIMNDFASLWLDAFLKDDAAAFSSFMDSTITSDRVATQVNCISTSLPDGQHERAVLFPVPADMNVTVAGVAPGTIVTIIDNTGAIIKQAGIDQDGSIDVYDLRNGIYTLSFTRDRLRTCTPLVILHR